MKSFPRNWTVASRSLFLLIAITSIGAGQTPLKRFAEQSIITCSVSRDQIWPVLGNLASENKVPIGIESPVDTMSGYENDIAPIEIRSGTVADVLNAVITFRPEYKWEEIDGAINLFPKVNREPLLDVEISRFRVDRARTSEILDALVETQEVKRRLLELGLRIDQTAFPQFGTVVSEFPRYNIQLENVKVRDVLNCLIKETDNKYWHVKRVGPQKNLISIIVS